MGTREPPARSAGWVCLPHRAWYQRKDVVRPVRHAIWFTAELFAFLLSDEEVNGFCVSPKSDNQDGSSDTDSPRPYADQRQT